jgi:hypothetical protein
MHSMNAVRAAPYILAILTMFLVLPMALTAPFEHLALFSDEGRKVVLAVAILFGFISMVLLLPDFDGRTDEDWDGQGRDDLWKS